MVGKENDREDDEKIRRKIRGRGIHWKDGDGVGVLLGEFREIFGDGSFD